MEIEKIIKEKLYRDISNDKINITLIEQIHGLSRSRIDVYANYELAVHETNEVYIFQIKMNKANEKLETIKFVIFEKNSPQDILINKYDTLSEAYENIRFRERYLIDIFQEFKLFNMSVEQFNNMNASNLNISAKVVKSKNQKKVYSFEIYLNDKLIAKEVPNIYSLNIEDLINDSKNIVRTKNYEGLNYSYMCLDDCYTDFMKGDN